MQFCNWQGSQVGTWTHFCGFGCMDAGQRQKSDIDIPMTVYDPLEAELSFETNYIKQNPLNNKILH